MILGDFYVVSSMMSWVQAELGKILAAFGQQLPGFDKVGFLILFGLVISKISKDCQQRDKVLPIHADFYGLQAWISY